MPSLDPTCHTATRPTAWTACDDEPTDTEAPLALAELLGHLDAAAWPDHHDQQVVLASEDGSLPIVWCVDDRELG